MAPRARHIDRILMLAVIAGASVASIAAGQPAAPADTPVEKQPAAPAADAPGIKQAEDLLSKLESADRGLTAMQSEIMLHRTFELAGDDQTRWGMLYFRQKPSADHVTGIMRQFAVRFDQLMIDRRVESKEQMFIFDGQWLAEVHPAEKRFNRKQLVGPGENFDPLRIGEGPLPIPIGQRKEDILARFVAEVVPVTDGIEDGGDPKQAAEWRKFVAGSTQLKLTPRNKGEQEDFSLIRLWYKPANKQEGIEDGRMLPRMSRTINRAGDVTTVQLVGISLNFPADERFEKFFDTALPKERGWDIIESPLARVPQPAQKLETKIKVVPEDKPGEPDKSPKTSPAEPAKPK
ncbi:MAG: hypothetical protein IT435_02910 [Phycisphaerales bacterium]|nr:hypothetical protein [Phycisphaerales bacterium]